MIKYVKVIDGTKSNANGFKYKLNKVNIAETWNSNADNPKEMGGFNFSTETKILRWLHRGDTIYDVTIPDDAEVKLCDKEKGIYRSNKIIISNPRKITNELVLELYKKNTLSNKIIAQCLKTLLWKNRLEISKYIIKDRVNKDNINEIFNEYKNYSMDKNFGKPTLEGDTKIIYDILNEINSNLYISLYVDKEPYIKEITKDKVINITGESGSGKSTFTNKYKNDDNYTIIDTDNIFNKKHKNIYEEKLSNIFNNKDKTILIEDFDYCYNTILNELKNINKTIVIDSAQFRNMKDINNLKGKLIIIRTCIDTCYNRCIERYKKENHNFSEKELKKYSNRKKDIYKWYKYINLFIENVNNLK